MKVYKNFLDKKEFDFIKNTICGENFPWYRTSFLLQDKEGKDNIASFFHMVYQYRLSNSTFYDLLEPIIYKINPVSLIRIRLNLYTPQPKHQKTRFHEDVADAENYHTAILYITKNNGPTEFKDKKIKIMPEENTFVMFKSSEYHRAITPTDKDKILINFNFYPSTKGLSC